MIVLVQWWIEHHPHLIGDVVSRTRPILIRKSSMSSVEITVPMWGSLLEESLSEMLKEAPLKYIASTCVRLEQPSVQEVLAVIVVPCRVSRYWKEYRVEGRKSNVDTSRGYLNKSMVRLFSGRGGGGIKTDWWHCEKDSGLFEIMPEESKLPGSRRLSSVKQVHWWVHK